MYTGGKGFLILLLFNFTNKHNLVCLSLILKGLTNFKVSLLLFVFYNYIGVNEVGIIIDWHMFSMFIKEF